MIETALKDALFFPHWLDNASAPTTRPQLIGPTDTDLLIIGGGFTGLWAAIQAKEDDPQRDVVLIEAAKIAYGASGRPGGIVGASVMHGLANAERIFPKDIHTLEALGQRNMDGFLASLDRYGIDCDAEWNGELTVAVNDEGRNHVIEEHRNHLIYGHESVFLDEQAVQGELRSPLFRNGFWAKGHCGTVHPAKLAWGLKAAALKLGVRLYETTPMLRVADLGAKLVVHTPDGRVSARRVLFATNAFATGNRHIKQRVAMVRDRILATEPLSVEQMGRIGWRNRQGVYDTRTQFNYMRLTKDNRIVFGGRLGYYYNGKPDPLPDRQPEVYQRLAKAFLATFPQLDDLRFTHAWSGPIGLTTRMAVHFQKYHGGKAYYAGGYSGFGVSASRFGARMALYLLDGAVRPECRMDIVTTMPNWIPPEPFRYLGARITMHAVDTLDEKGGWRAPWLRLVRAMGFPLS